MATVNSDPLMLQSLPQSSGIGMFVGDAIGTSGAGQAAPTVAMLSNGQYISNGVISGEQFGSAAANAVVSPALSNVGALSALPDGTYSYTVPSSAAQQLAQGVTHTDSFVVQTVAGDARTLNFSLTSDPQGLFISAPAIGAVDQSSGVLTNSLTASGFFPVSAQGQMPSVTGAQGGGAASLGSLSISDSGQYTYSVASSVTQAISANDTKIDTFTLVSQGGASQQISFTLHGAGNDNGLAQSPITVSEPVNSQAVSLTSPGDAAMTALDYAALGFWRVQVLGGGAPSASSLIAGSVLSSGSQVPIGAIVSDDSSAGARLAMADPAVSSPKPAAIDMLPPDNLVSPDVPSVNTPLDMTAPQGFALLRTVQLVTAPAPAPAEADPAPEVVAYSIAPVSAARVPTVIGELPLSSVQEDTNVVADTLSVSGTIPISAETTELTAFDPVVLSAGGNLGQLVLGASGNYTYSVPNSTVQYLGASDSRVDTFTIFSVDGTSKDITFTVQGVNDPAVIGDPTVTSVTESLSVVAGNLQASGSISVADVDQNQSFFQTTVTSAAGDLGNLVLNGDGTYIYRVPNDAVRYLAAAEDRVDTFTVTSLDGTTKDVYFTIRGINEAAVITGATTGSVTEAGGVLNADPGAPLAVGTLNASDVDSPANTFLPVASETASSQGFGTYTITSGGEWHYTLDNGLAAVQALNVGDVITDTFVAYSVDGTPQLVTMTIRGANDAAVITGTPTANVTETNAVLTTGGSLTATDVDGSADFVAQSGVAGSNGYGTFSINPAGAWTYTTNTAHNEFVGGTTYSESVTVATADGTTQVLTVNILGTNEPAVIAGTSTANLTETDVVLTTGGSLTATDVDSSAAFVAQTGVAGANGYGTFSINPAGAWTYTTRTPHDEFVGGTTYTDSATVATADGTTQVISVSILGTNDAAVITGTRTVNATETNAVLTTGGSLSATDVDSSAAFVAQTGVAGANGYGTFSINPAGAWTYTTSTPHDEFVGGTTYTDSATVATADGTTQVISVSILGTNDAAVITGTRTADATEMNAVLTAGGSLTATDVDSSAAFVAQTGVAGANGYGTFSIDPAGVWTYTTTTAHNEFVGGTTYIDRATVATADGTTQIISVSILGTNDAAVITGTHTASATETNAVLTTVGSLSATDVDSSADFVAQTGVAGTNGYGTFSINPAGAWTYATNTPHDEFVGGTTYTDSATVATADGTTQVLTVSILGTNDAAVITGTSSVNATETNAVLTTGGSLTATDVDSSAAFVAQTGVAGANGYGSFSINPAGVWTYTTNTPHDEFVGGTTYTDSVTVATADGTTQVISVNILGTNDAAVITGARSANLTETNAVLTAGGTLTATDVDGSADFVAQTGVAGSNGYGTFSINPAGVWTYTTNTPHNEFVGGTTYSESVTVATVDGTTQVLTVNILGTIDASVITGISTANLTETNAVLTTGGSLTAITTDAGISTAFVIQAGVAGNNGYGAFSINPAGVWTYSTNTPHNEFVGGTTYTDYATVVTTDDTTQVLTVNILGTNDPAIIGNPSVASVMESKDTQNGYLIATGIIPLTDLDLNQSIFSTVVGSAPGNNGELTLAPDGSYTYSVLNSAEIHLASLETKVDTFTITSADGTSKDVSFTIFGINNTAVIGDPTSTSVTENDHVVSGRLSTSGTISVSDPDTGQAVFQTVVTSAPGTLGTLTLTAGGAYTYSVDNSAVQYLGAFQTKAETFTIKSMDGTSKDVTFTIRGVNEAAVIGDPNPASVTEDSGVVGGVITLAGVIPISDADQNQAAFQTTVSSAPGDMGQLNLSANGTFSYVVNNNTLQYLGASDTLVDTFTVTSLDGTSKDVRFTIYGVNDPAVIGDPTNGNVTEDTNLFRGDLFASGTISISDIDQGQASFRTSVINAPGDWGTLVLAADGSYSYSVANNLAALQALNANQSKADTFTITSFDGTTKDVTFYIHGMEDGNHTAPTAVGNQGLANGLDIISLRVGDQSNNFALLTGAKPGVYDNHLTAISPTFTETINGVVVSHAMPAWMSFLDSGPILFVNPSYSYADLKALGGGQTAIVDINYNISDGHGALIAQSAEVIVTGQYRTPTLDITGLTDTLTAGTGTQNIDLIRGAHALYSAGLTISDVTIAIDGGAPAAASLAGATPIGANTTFSIDTSNAAYSTLGVGQHTTAVISYNVVEQYGASVHQTETLTINGPAQTSVNGVISGTANSDILTGTAANETLNGGAGSDTLNAGAGNDILNGGSGADLLTGGSGADIFKYLTLADSPTSQGAPTDTIMDFNALQGDRVDLSALLTANASVHSTIHIGQSGASTTTLSVTIGGTEYYIANILGQEITVPTALANPASSVDLTTALHGAGWTDVVDVTSAHGGPASVTAAAGASVANSVANPAGDWTATIQTGAAVVDAAHQLITLTTPAPANDVVIYTADNVVHDIANVTTVQWHA